MRTRERITIDVFMERAAKLHGDRYSYGKVNIDNGSRSQVTITCREHGDFTQRTDRHLEGKGCALCGNKKKYRKTPETRATFVAKAKMIHGDKYDYSLVEYKGSRKKVTIVCLDHGLFDIRADSHTWQKAGCPVCAQEVRTAKQSDDGNSFIAKAIAIHGNRYDYSKVSYTRSGKKVTIICKEHGNFSITPNKHITDRQGCPWCSDSISNGERAIAARLDELGVAYRRQASFDGLRTTRPLLFDFHLPDRNLLIEYHGEQHYRPCDFFGGIEGFERRVQLDERKRQWAINNGYRFIEIPYTIVPSVVGTHLDDILGQVKHG